MLKSERLFPHDYHAEWCLSLLSKKFRPRSYKTFEREDLSARQTSEDIAWSFYIRNLIIMGAITHSYRR